MIRYMEFEHVIRAHDAVLKESGGASGNINEDYINCILEFIKNDDYYPSFIEKLSYLVYSIAVSYTHLLPIPMVFIVIQKVFFLITLMK